MTKRTLSWLAIPTRNRPRELSLAIDSYADNLARSGRCINWLIADDSDLSGCGAAHVTLLAALARHPACKSVLYVDGPTKRRIVSLLADQQTIPKGVLEFGLLGSGYTSVGANRNIILLLTAGTTVLTVDDDTVCEPRWVPAPKDVPALQVGRPCEPTELWFFNDRQDALSFGDPLKVDVIGEHSALLGECVADLASNAARADWSTMCGHLHNGILSRRAVVAVAQSVLSQAELAAARANPSLVAATYGKAVERQVAQQVAVNPALSDMFQWVTRPGAAVPDFVGVGRAAGMTFDITTPAQAGRHLARPYGSGLNVITYTRPAGFAF